MQTLREILIAGANDAADTYEAQAQGKVQESGLSIRGVFEVLESVFSKKLYKCVGWDDLSTRLKRSLKDWGYYYLGEVSQQTEAEWMRFPGLGRVSVQELNRFVEKNGSAFGLNVGCYAERNSTMRLRAAYQEPLFANKNSEFSYRRRQSPSFAQKMKELGVTTLGELVHTSLNGFSPEDEEFILKQFQYHDLSKYMKPVAVLQ